MQILSETFFGVHKDVSQGDFLKWLDKQPEQNREAIHRVVDPIFKRKQELSGYHDYHISELAYTGYVFYDFHKIDEATHDITMDAYFIPFSDSRGFQPQVNKEKFANCL